MQQEGIQALQVLRRAGFSISLFLMAQRNFCVKQYHEVTSLQAYVCSLGSIGGWRVLMVADDLKSVISRRSRSIDLAFLIEGWLRHANYFLLASLWAS